MNNFLRGAAFGLGAAIMAFALAAPAAEQRTTLTIKSDGTSTLTAEKTEVRALAEQQARAWERYYRQRLAEDGDGSARPPAKEDQKPLTDDELARKIRAAFEAQAEERVDEVAGKLDVVEVQSNTVRTVTTQRFASLEEMLQQSRLLWPQTGLSFENVKFEKDGDGRLRVTFVPRAEAQRYARNARQQWKLTGAQSEFRLVFPGKIQSSGLPDTRDNATWIVLDARKPESMDAAVKLYEGPTIITAELAGLKLDQPLESRLLTRSRRSSGGGPDLPITDAEPGFAAEPMALTTTTLYYFPGGEQPLQKAGRFNLGQTGAVVRVRFFAPKQRTLQAISGVRVLKAVDDKGRPIAAAEESNASESAVYSVGAGAHPGNSTQVSLRLELPPADAQSIDELTGEAIALTAGAWKELALTNLTASSTNEIDLAQVLPGAKLAITRFTSKNRQFNLRARLTGPVGVRQIELQAKTTGRYSSTAGAYERSYAIRNGQATRLLELNQYRDLPDNELDQAPTIIVRFPEDQRRERVRFAFKGLDLF